MTGAFCSHCGRPIPAAAVFCPSCGASTTPSGAQAGVPLPPSPGYLPYGGVTAPTFAQPYPRPAGPSPADREADRRALSSVNLAAILGLVSAAIGLVSLFTNQATSLVTSTTTSSGTTYSVDLAVLYTVAALAAIGFVLGIVELILYRRAFKLLDRMDSSFGTPATLVLLALISIFLLILTFAGLLGLLAQSLSCAGSSGGSAGGCVNFGALLGLLGIVIVLAILVFVGYIGLLIGIWRLGNRYDEGLFKAGAILLIFPVLDLVGLVLILVAVRSARHKVDAGPFSPTF